MFTFTTVPRFEDLDCLGIVNNARFLTYAEEARVAFLRDTKLAGSVIVGRIECDFKRPILLERGPVTVKLAVGRVGTSSFTVDHELLQAGETVARLLAVVVAYDYQAGHSRKLEQGERDMLLTRRAPLGDAAATQEAAPLPV